MTLRNEPWSMYSSTIFMVPLQIKVLQITLFVVGPDEWDQISAIIARQKRLQVIYHLVSFLFIENVNNLQIGMLNHTFTATGQL